MTQQCICDGVTSCVAPTMKFPATFFNKVQKQRKKKKTKKKKGEKETKRMQEKRDKERMCGHYFLQKESVVSIVPTSCRKKKSVFHVERKCGVRNSCRKKV